MSAFVVSTSSLLSVCLLFAAPVSAQLTKQVAAPPEDILSGRVALPDPAALADHSRTAWVEVRFDAQGLFTSTLPVGSAGVLSLVPLAPDAEAWEIALDDGSGAWRTLAARVADGTARALSGEGFPGLPGEVVRYDVDAPGAATLALRVTRAPSSAAVHGLRAPDGVLLVADGEP
ncbi:MAG: hypothetical protein H6825_16665, partial [Planctomycetes bacterium]|nr:hypothetical protein [Planctomycetota bacterium]